MFPPDIAKALRVNRGSVKRVVLMMTKTDRRKRALSLMLVALFTTSLMTAFAAPAGASMARTYTAGRDPQEAAAELDSFLARHRAPDAALRAALIDWLLSQVSE